MRLDLVGSIDLPRNFDSRRMGASTGFDMANRAICFSIRVRNRTSHELKRTTMNLLSERVTSIWTILGRRPRHSSYQGSFD
jgi:hypothetical protein